MLFWMRIHLALLKLLVLMLNALYLDVTATAIPNADISHLSGWL